jgi:hypothetical protein
MQVFPVRVAGTGLSGVAFGSDSASSEDVWLEDPITLEPLVPIEWVGEININEPAEKSGLLHSSFPLQTQQQSAAMRFSGEGAASESAQPVTLVEPQQSSLHGSTGSTPAEQPPWANDVAFGSVPKLKGGGGSRKLASSTRLSNGVLAHVELRTAARLQGEAPSDVLREKSVQVSLTSDFLWFTLQAAKVQSLRLEKI